MRKKLCYSLFVLVLTLSLIGCAKEEMPSEFEEMGFTQEEYEELKDMYEDAFESDDATKDTEQVPAKEDETVTDEVPAEVTDSYELFDPVSEWNDVTPTDRAVQIDDTLYVPGVMLGDFMAKVDNSSITYEYEYNASKLMRERDGETINFSRNGTVWFSIQATNIFKETKSLSEVPVIYIDVKEVALPYIRLINGTSYSDVVSKNYTYQEVENLAKSLFGSDCTFEKENSATRYDEECISILYVLNDEYLPNVTEWSDYDVTARMGYTFYVSKNTNQLIDFRVSTPLAYSWKISDGGLIESLDQLTNEMVDRIITDTCDGVEELYSVDINFKSLYGMAIAQHLMIESERSLWMILEVEADGELKYLTVELPRFHFTKNFINLDGTWYVGELYDTAEEAIEAGDYSHKVVEKTY